MGSIFKKILKLALFTVVMDLVIALLFLRDQAADDLKFRVSNTFYHHDLLPNINCKDTWFDKTYKMTTNSLGFKGLACSKVSRENTKDRVLLMGDSFTEGIGIPYPETFAGILQNKMPEIEILNAGVASYSPHLYYLKTKYLLEIAKLEFKKIVVFIDMSDAQDEVIYRNFQPIFSQSSASWLDKIYVFLYNHSIVGNRCLRLVEKKKLKKSEAYTTATELGYKNLEEFWQFRGNWTTDSTAWNRWAKNGIEMAKNHLIQLNTLCSRENIELCIVIYPWLEQLERRETMSLQVQIWEEFAQEHQIQFLNLFPAFMGQEVESFGDEMYIKGDVHWNEKGHNFVANLIFEANLFHE